MGGQQDLPTGGQRRLPADGQFVTQGDCDRQIGGATRSVTMRSVGQRRPQFDASADEIIGTARWKRDLLECFVREEAPGSG